MNNDRASEKQPKYRKTKVSFSQSEAIRLVPLNNRNSSQDGCQKSQPSNKRRKILPSQDASAACDNQDRASVNRDGIQRPQFVVSHEPEDTNEAPITVSSRSPEITALKMKTTVSAMSSHLSTHPNTGTRPQSQAGENEKSKDP